MRLLLVEDNVRLAEFMRDGLYKAGFELDHVTDAQDAEATLDAQNYDAVVLDLGLPDRDGMGILRNLRHARENIPVLIVTARDGLDDRVRGLNSGADDYLVKPFDIEELTARVHALLRRPGQALGTILEAGNLIFNAETRQLEINGRELDLSRRETDLTEQFMRNINGVLPKASIESRLYSYGEEGSANAVEVLVHRLRRKLEDNNAGVEIHTLRDVGYMMREIEQGEHG